MIPKERPAVRLIESVVRLAIVGTMTLCLHLALASGLDPGLPPGGNFDLSHWKLTLPDGNATEIDAAQLVAGYSNATYFYTGPDGAMTFWAPVTGGVTAGTGYPRCELRELLDPDNENANWSGYGTNRLEAQCKVTRVPSSRTVIIGQIHGFTGDALPLVKLQFDDGTVEALVKQSPSSSVDTVFSFGDIGLNNPIAYQLSLTDGLLSMTVNGTNQSVNVFQSDRAWSNQRFYFKAGSYCQDKSGPTNEGSAVAFSKLSVEHIRPAETLPGIMFTNWGVDAHSNLTMTLLAPGGGNCFVQTSTNLVDWNYLLITNSGFGQIDFSDRVRPGMRYYRAGAFSVVTIINSAVDRNGHPAFTLIGPGSGNYFIETSTDFINWSYLLITNSASGQVDFKDTTDPGTWSLRFYRCGSF